MKTPIAMRCTQDQFDAVKPKLLKQNISLLCLSDFNQFPYLVNFLGVDENIVSNLLERAVNDSDCERYEEWNEKVFLEACGIKVKPSKLESLEKRVEFLEQEVKKAKPDNEEKNLWDRHPSKETYEELKNNFVSFVNYSVEKGWLPKPNNFHLSEVKRIVDEGKIKIPSWMERQKDADQLGKMYFGIDFGVSDSYNEIIMPRAFKIPTHSTHLCSELKHETDSVPARAYNELKSLNKSLRTKNNVLTNENALLKLRVEELEAVNAEILKGNPKEIITDEDWKNLAVAGTDLKLEVGKWYKSLERPKQLVFVLDIQDNNPQRIKGYGFGIHGQWEPDDNKFSWGLPISGDYWIAEESEVLEALTKEAVKRGFVGEQYIDITELGFKNDDLITGGQITWDGYYLNFGDKGTAIYRNGVWGKVVDSITKKDAEKELGKKII